MEVSRQAGALGACVTGVDVADLDDATFKELHDALLEHLVICIRGQAHVTPDDQVAFLGEVGPHRAAPRTSRRSTAIPRSCEVYDPNPITVTWHSDFTYAKRPPSISLLLARMIPPVGGDTMFSNGYLAYEGLSPGLRDTLTRLRAVHYATADGDREGHAGGRDRQLPSGCAHAPRDRPRALFVNGNYTPHFDDWSIDDSQPLLDHLYAQFGRFEYTWRHRWQVGDLLIWDNRCAQHAVVGDTAGQERSLHRTTIAGDTPR